MREEERQQTLITVIEDEMKTAYIDYAMSVIVGRALPDVRDGLKPVHRRILYAMKEMGLKHNSPFKKCARIVGEVLGKFHPHGDSAVYDALVRMAQDFSLRYPLVEGQGNFGSVDGDSPAAMRYTEARLARITEDLLQDIEKETVNFKDNFDGSLKEPEVLPGKVPNLLINGSSGIAVGMATNIPPHNLREVCSALINLIDNPSMTVEELMRHVKGPDFPTRGVIAGRRGILEAYKTGKGKIKVKGKVSAEEGDKPSLVITEIPYMVNKAQLVEQIANLVKEKRIDGISNIRDESDRKGMRVVIELKKGSSPEVVKNALFKHTKLATTFSIMLIALVNNEPVLLTLKGLMQEYLKHRKEVVLRRTRYELRKAEERSHLLAGLLTALRNIDQVVKLIKSSESVDEARNSLIQRFKLSEKQSTAILEMKLQKLSSLEQRKVKEEYSELQRRIKRYKEIISSEEEVKKIMKEELKELMEKYGDDRRTLISQEDAEIDIEDLIEEEEVVVTLTNKDYVKRTSIETYRLQHRGGRGVIGATTRDEDFVERVFTANTHSYLLVFTDKGKVYWLKVYQIPEGSRTARGTPIINLLRIDPGEKVRAVIPVKDFSKGYLLTATKMGVVKKTPLSAYSHPRKGGIIALSILPGDSLINAAITSGDEEVILATKKGLAARFSERDVRPMGRSARGVTGIRLSPQDEVVSMIVCRDGEEVFTLTRNGYGKKSNKEDYRLIRRGGKGVINLKITEKNGEVVSVKSVKSEDELIIVTRKGILIRVSSQEVRTIGRNTQGVRVIRLEPGDEVVSAAKVEANE